MSFLRICVGEPSRWVTKYHGQIEARPSLGRARTRNFKINTNAPICIALRTVNIQIPKPHLLHALSDDPCFFVPRDADFVSIVWLVCGVEGVNEEEVDWCVGSVDPVLRLLRRVL